MATYSRGEAINAFGKVLSIVLALGSLAGGRSVHLSTWTIVAVDRNTGDVGVAGATCLPGQHADAVAVLIPGKGAAAVQAFWDLQNRNNVYQLVRQGESADEVRSE